MKNKKSVTKYILASLALLAVLALMCGTSALSPRTLSADYAFERYIYSVSLQDPESIGSQLDTHSSPVINLFLNVNENFTDGLVYFNYSLRSDRDISVLMLADINCPNGSKPLLNPLVINLKKGVWLKNRYDYLKIDSMTIPQECTARVSILSPEKYSVQKKFRITIPPIAYSDIKLDLVKGFLSTDSRVPKGAIYYKGQRINIQLTNIDMAGTATISAPSGKVVTLTLPSTYVLSETGKYTMKIVSAKKGFRQNEKTVTLYVIASPTMISVSDEIASKRAEMKQEIDEALRMRNKSVPIVANE